MSVKDAVFRSEIVLQEMGLEIVGVDFSSGRLEATATSFWFGFKDDVVIRIQTVDGETQLDIRSKSRVGRSDVGKNAERIREFLAAL